MPSRALALVALLFSAPAAAVTTLTITIEAPGVQESTASFHHLGVERFNRPTGTNLSFTSDFGTGGLISGSYAGVRIDGPNKFGSATGAGNHAVIFANQTYDVSLSTSIPGGLNYFGFWLSALDPNNSVTLMQGSTALFTLSSSVLLPAINAQPDAASYFGNPNPPFLGQNKHEPYAFVNFFVSGGFFDRIIFSQGAWGGLESDNHSVGRWSTMGGTPIVTIDIAPEPQSWALFIAGFGLIGGALRRRQRQALPA